MEEHLSLHLVTVKNGWRVRSKDHFCGWVEGGEVWTQCWSQSSRGGGRQRILAVEQSLEYMLNACEGTFNGD
jgi:hypothetical protein